MATRRSHARRLQAAQRSARRTLQGNAVIGWAAAVAVLVVLAFVVGGPAAEQGLLGGTPAPSAAPPLTIRFGQGLDPQTNRATPRTRRFRSGDPFAYSVTLAQRPGTRDILVEVTRLDGGRRVVVQEPSLQHIQPQARTFAFQVETDDLLEAWGAGDYEMRIFLGPGSDPIAIGRFTLIATPGAGKHNGIGDVPALRSRLPRCSSRSVG
jgi:hypothetical protein